MRNAVRCRRARVAEEKILPSVPRVQGSGFRVQGSGFRVQGSGFRFQGSGLRVQGSGFRVQFGEGVGCTVYPAESPGFRVFG